MFNDIIRNFRAAILFAFSMAASVAAQASLISDQFVFHLVGGGVVTNTFTVDDENNAPAGGYLISSVLGAANAAFIGDYDIFFESDGITVSDYVGIVSDGHGGATYALASDPMGLPTAFTHYTGFQIERLTAYALGWEQAGYFEVGLNPVKYNVAVITDGVVRSDVPEPAVIGLFGLGLAGMVFGRRRNRG